MDSPTRLLEHAQAAYESGDVETAMSLTKGYLRGNIHDGRGWEMLGLIHHARCRFKLAVSSLERASLYVPLRPCGRVCLAYGYAKIGRTALARDLLAELINDQSMPDALLLQVAIGLDSIDQPGLAMRACRVVLHRDPDQAQPYYDLAYYAARCGYPNHVTESLARKAISLDPANATYRIGLASKLIKQDRDKDAYDLVKNLSNDQIESITCRCCLERIADLFEAQQDYERVAKCRQHLLTLELRGIGDECG